MLVLAASPSFVSCGGQRPVRFVVGIPLIGGMLQEIVFGDAIHIMISQDMINRSPERLKDVFYFIQISNCLFPLRDVILILQIAHFDHKIQIGRVEDLHGLFQLIHCLREITGPIRFPQELKGNNKPVIIFIHQLLDRFSDISKSLCVSNADEIVPLLEENGNVLAVFQGHHHAGHYSFRNNIHYWTMKGMIEGNLPDNNSFAVVEIDTQNNIHIDGFYNCEDKDLNRFTV